MRSDKSFNSLKVLHKEGYLTASLYGKQIHLLARGLVVTKADVERKLIDQGIYVDRIEPQPLTMENVFVHRILQLERQSGAFR